jgi:hypothetical protein
MRFALGPGAYNGQKLACHGTLPQEGMQIDMAAHIWYNPSKLATG